MIALDEFLVTYKLLGLDKAVNAGTTQAILNAINTANAYTEQYTTSMWNDRGLWDASGNVFPSDGGSGVGGAIKLGDTWLIIDDGTLGMQYVQPGDIIKAVIDNPGQTESNWTFLETNLGYVPLNKVGDTLTGTGGNGALGYPLQSAAPSNPASGIKVFANADGNLATIDTAGNITDIQLSIETLNANSQGIAFINMTDVDYYMSAEESLKPFIFIFNAESNVNVKLYFYYSPQNPAEYTTITCTAPNCIISVVSGEFSELSNEINGYSRISFLGTTSVVSRMAITDGLMEAGTGIKFTYNQYGVITGVSTVSTADIPESTNRNYVTDTQQTFLDALAFDTVPTEDSTHLVDSGVVYAAIETAKSDALLASGQHGVIVAPGVDIKNMIIQTGYTTIYIPEFPYFYKGIYKYFPGTAMDYTPAQEADEFYSLFYLDTAGTLQKSKNTQLNSTLVDDRVVIGGIARTLPSDPIMPGLVQLIDNYPMYIDNQSQLKWQRFAIGTLYTGAAGLLSNSSTDNKLNMSGGDVFIFNTDLRRIPATPNVTFAAMYSDGGFGYTQLPATDVYSTIHYDNGTGTLATLPDGKYAVYTALRDAAVDFTTFSGIVVVYPKTYYDTLTEALSAPIDSGPYTIENGGAFTYLCRLIFIKGDVNITAVQDDRPRIGTSSTVSSSSNSAYDIAWSGTIYGGTVDTVGDALDSTATAIAAKQNTSAKGNANGYAGLDVNAKVPINQLPDSILGALKFKGTWNANTNIITSSDLDINGLAVPVASSSNEGWYFIVDTNGTTTIDTIAEWKVGDWILSIGSVYKKIDNTDAVVSVNSLTGAVSLTTATVPDSTDKRYVTDAHLTLLGNTSGTNTGDKTLADLGGVPTSRTVNGHALTGDVTVTQSDVGLPNVNNTSDVNKPVSIAQALADGAVLTSAQGYADGKVQDSLVASTTLAPSVSAVNGGLSAKEATANKGVANGYASLDANTKVPVSQLPDSIVGALKFKGTWNATTNIITSSDGTINGLAVPAAASTNEGWYFITTVDGASNVGGITDWKVGDWVLSIGSAWKKIDNTDAVASVNGLTGAVTLTTANVADSTDKRYVTDAQLVVIANTSGTNIGAETLTTTGALINSATNKATPVDADYIGLMDSAASNILKKVSWANIKATWKAYTDTLYLALPTTNGIAVRTGATTAVSRAIAAITGLTTISNGDGVSGDPTVGVALTTSTYTTATDYTVTSTSYASINAAVRLTGLAAGSYLVICTAQLSLNANAVDYWLGLHQGAAGSTTLVTGGELPNKEDYWAAVLTTRGSSAFTVTGIATITAGQIIEPKVKSASGTVTCHNINLVAVRVA